MIAALALISANTPPDHEWAHLAWVGYAAGAGSVGLAMATGASSFRTRTAIALGVFVLVGIAPLAVDLTRTNPAGVVRNVKSDVIVVELGARAIVDGNDPYNVVFGGALTEYPQATREHYPYMPGSLVFGVPSTIWANQPAADPRVPELAIAVIVFWFAVRAWSASPEAKLASFRWIFAMPLEAAFVSTSGKEPPVLALMFLALVLLHENRDRAGGVAAGLAASLSQLALPVLPFLLRRGDDQRTRAAALISSLVVVAAAAAPFLVWHPAEFVKDAILYPLGIGQPSGQTTFTLGGSIVRLWPAARGPIALAVGAVALAGGLYVGWRRPASDAAGVALRAGALLAFVVAFAPRARVGYVAFPLDLLVLWRIFGSSPKRASARDRATETPRISV